MELKDISKDSYYRDSSIRDSFKAAHAPMGPTREAAKLLTRARNQKNSYDITNKYDWTSVPPNTKYREEAPSAMVTAYELDNSQLQHFIDGYMNIIVAETEAAKNPGSDAGMEFYRNIYKTNRQLASFNFPFFSDNIRNFTTEFTDSFSPISQRGAKWLGAKEIEGLGGMGEKLIGGTIAGMNQVNNLGGNAVSDKIAGYAKGLTRMAGDAAEKWTGLKMPGFQTVGAPGSYIETPQFYQYSNTDAALDINFVLSNTITRDGQTSYEKNQTFIKEFTKMNRPKRLGAIGMTFPAIYHIEVPGLRYIQWAFLSNFNIGLLGTRRKIDNKILPEAFSCQFSFRSLTMEAANFMDEIDDMAPYNDKDDGYIALRTRADEARAKTLKEQRKAAEKRAEASKEPEVGWGQRSQYNVAGGGTKGGVSVGPDGYLIKESDKDSPARPAMQTVGDATKNYDIPKFDYPEHDQPQEFNPRVHAYGNLTIDALEGRQTEEGS